MRGFGGGVRGQMFAGKKMRTEEGTGSNEAVELFL